MLSSSALKIQISDTFQTIKDVLAEMNCRYWPLTFTKADLEPVIPLVVQNFLKFLS